MSAGNSTDISTPATKRPGRQRSSEVDQAILDATLEVLVEGGYGNFSIKKVINRAGVSSATLYRRWNTADELVIAALRSIHSPAIEIDTGNFDQDLKAFLVYLGEALENFEDIAIAEASGPRASEAMRNEVAAMFAIPRKQILQQLIDKAVKRGELANPLPISVCWTFVVSPIHHHLHLQGKALTEKFIQQTHTVLSSGIRALAASCQR